MHQTTTLFLLGVSLFLIAVVQSQMDSTPEPEASSTAEPGAEPSGTPEPANMAVGISSSILVIGFTMIINAIF